MSVPQKLPRALAAHARLEMAQTALSALVLERDALALDALENQPGADKALTAHRAKIELAERQVSEMAGAVKLAERLDREADALSAIAMRAAQFAIFEKAIGERVDAGAEMLAAIAKATAAYGRYVKAAEQMATALPTGTALPVMQFEGYAGSFLGNGEALVGRESFRVAGPGPKPPFAKLPMLSAGDDPSAMRPGADVMRETHDAVLRDIKVQIGRLDNEARDRATLAATEKAA